MDKYIQLVHTLYTKKDQSDSFYSNLLKQMFQYIIDHTEMKFSKNKPIGIFKEFHEKTKEYISNLDIFTITQYNIRCLQYVIMFTAIEQMTNYQDDTTMQNYFQARYYNISDVFIQFYECFNDYHKLYDIMMTDDTFKSLIGKDVYTYKPEYNCEFKEYSFKDMNKLRIMCFFGDFDIKYIIEAYINEVYYIGVNTSMEWADGNKLTPFEFVHHDITHANNRGFKEGYDVKYELKWWKYINDNKNDIPKDVLEQVYLIGFLIIHESMTEYMLERTNISNCTFKSIGPMFIQNMDNWVDEHFYGSLLPDGLKGIYDRDAITEYLNDSFAQFRKLYLQAQESV